MRDPFGAQAPRHVRTLTWIGHRGRPLLEQGYADLVAFGRRYISTSDLPSA